MGRVLEGAFREAVTEMALLTPQLGFLRANAAMGRLLGRREAELATTAVEEIAHPDDRASVRAALDEARSGVLCGFRIWARAIGADGSVIPMLVATTMLRDESGDDLCFFVQVLDVESSPSAPLPPGLDHQPVVDFTCDREGRLVAVSPVAQLSGWNPEELQSVATLDLVHPADRARVEAAVYKIVEEALTNVMRHASAPVVTIFLRHGGDMLAVVIEDDGVGFEPEHRSLTAGSGMGLLCMEERARLLDGTLKIESAPGKGTVVRATLPVPPPGSPPIGRDGVAARLTEGGR